jgi:uncharacterized membrane protein
MSDEGTAGRGKPPGQTTERIGAFVDAVLAIAMTLLVLDIPRPDKDTFSIGSGVSKAQAFRNLWNFLWAQHDVLYAYLLAFAILWIVWRQHHELFDQFDRITPSMVRWHFPLLLFAAFLPYSTSILGSYSDNPMAALLYGSNVFVILLTRSLVQRQALRGGALIAEADEDHFRRAVIVSWAVTGYWLLTLAFFWWAPWSEIPWFFTSLVATLASRIVNRRPAAADPAT